MLKKEKIIQLIKELPDEFSLEEFVDKLILLEKIEIGLTQTKQGKVVSDGIAKQKLKKWLK